MTSEEGAAVDARQQQQSIEWFSYSKRVAMRSIVCREDKGLRFVGERVVVGGGVRSRKKKVLFRRSIARILMLKDGGAVQKPVAVPAKSEPVLAYLRINDGSCIADLQIVVDSSMSLPGQVMTIGTSVLVEGVLEKIPLPGKHVVQLKVEKILHVGIVDLKKYPLAEAKSSFEFLRVYPHLRPRTSIVS